MSHAHQREADFLAAFLAGGDALFAGVFLLAVLLAVFPTIFLIGTFFTPDLAAVLALDTEVLVSEFHFRCKGLDKVRNDIEIMTTLHKRISNL